MSDAISLHGRVVLVTGAAQGIGYETARHAHARGASVAIVDLDIARAEAAAASLGDRAIGLAADVTDRAAVADAVRATRERLGPIDVAVANAGIAPPKVRTTASIAEEDFERVVAVDLLGVWRTVRAVLPDVIERRGHVVVVASVYAFLNGMLVAPYAVSKAGVEQLGRALRVELAAHGASAGTAYFGFIDTQMVRDAFEEPLAKRMEEFFPDFMLRRLEPAQAGAAIVAGVERRAPRTILPRWFAAASALRGVLGPLTDWQMRRDGRIGELVREAEAEAAAERAARAAPVG